MKTKDHLQILGDILFNLKHLSFLIISFNSLEQRVSDMEQGKFKERIYAEGGITIGKKKDN